MLRWLIGVRFTRVQAFHAGRPAGDLPVHTTVALAKADNGAAAKITVSYGMVRPYCLYHAVYGADGSFERTRDQGGVLDDTVNLHAHRRYGRARRMTQVQLPNFANPRIARQLAGKTIGHGTMEVEQARDFLDADVQDREPVIGPLEVAASMLPLICALQSAAQGGGMIEVPVLT